MFWSLRGSELVILHVMEGPKIGLGFRGLEFCGLGFISIV